MTIQTRFLISYIGGIVIAIVSILIIVSMTFYVMTGSVPTPKKMYQSFSENRSLSSAEELAFVELRNIAKTEPEQLLTDDLTEILSEIESHSLDVVIRKDDEIVYYSEDLVEQSLLVHYPPFNANNVETKGTIDNAGKMYRYVKFNFYFSDDDKGSFLVLKRENNFLEFLTKWGIIIICSILILSVMAMFFLNHLIKKTVIKPLDNLGKVMSDIKEGNLQVETLPSKDKMAKEVQQLATNFENMRMAIVLSEQEQQHLENNRKKLIASISHDLKTPITSIIGYVEGLREGVADTPEKQARYLNTIHTKSLALDHLIEELFLYSKLDAEAVPFYFEKVKLAHFLEHIIEEFQLSYDDLQFQLDVADDLEITLDRMHMNRALTNIIENSMKFKKDDEKLHITIAAAQRENRVEMTIQDNGKGILKAKIPHVFEQFYRGEEARTSTTGGSGIGLAIVKQIVEKHAGTVTLQSEVGVGTTVHIMLEQDVKDVSKHADGASIDY